MPIPLPIAVDCPMAQVLDLRTEPDQPWALAPAGFGGPSAEVLQGSGPLPPPGDKGWYGSPVGETLQSDNFGVVWQPGQGSALEAQGALDALEAAWSTAIDDGDWLHPVSSHDYLVWVVLDPYLGSEGRTVAIESADYAEGVPVITLDPAVYADPDRFAVVAAHQFHHALQLRLRAQDKGVDAWFWESSASWGAAQALPTNPVRYADAEGFLAMPSRSIDDEDPDHSRGLMLLNAWLDQTGVATTRELWEAGRQVPATSWELVLPEQTGLSMAELFAGFSAAAGSGQLDDSALFGPLLHQGPLAQGANGGLLRLGVEAWQYTGPDPVVVRLSGVTSESDATLGSVGGVGSRVTVSPGEMVTVSSGAGYTAYQLYYDPVDGEGAGDPPRSGRADPSIESAIQGTCACGTPVGPDLGWIGLLGLIAVRRRNRA